MSRTITCGHCGAYNSNTYKGCVACKRPFLLNMHSQAKICKNPSCNASAVADHGLCAEHRKRQGERRAASLAQPKCLTCNNRLGQAMQDEGRTQCRACKPDTVPYSERTVVVPLKILDWLIEHAEDFAVDSDSTEFDIAKALADNVRNEE